MFQKQGDIALNCNCPAYQRKGENNEKGNTIDGVCSHSQLAGSNYRKCSHKK